MNTWKLNVQNLIFLKIIKNAFFALNRIFKLRKQFIFMNGTSFPLSKQVPAVHRLSSSL